MVLVKTRRAGGERLPFMPVLAKTLMFQSLSGLTVTWRFNFGDWFKPVQETLVGKANTFGLNFVTKASADFLGLQGSQNESCLWNQNQNLALPSASCVTLGCHLTSLSLSFLVSERVSVIALTSQDCSRNSRWCMSAWGTGAGTPEIIIILITIDHFFLRLPWLSLGN